MRSYPRLRSALAVLGAALVSLALAACGDDDKDKSDKSTASTPQAETLTLTGSTAGKATKLAGLPTKPVAGGAVTIRFTNTAKVPMEVQLVGVDGNHTAEQVRKQVLDSPEGAPTPPWAHGSGGSGVTKPGATSSSTLLLAPGKYYVQTDSQVESGETQAAILPLTVEGGDGGAKLPATDATISAQEYSFTSSGLKSGKNTILFDNKGAELHHVIALPIAQGKTIADVKKALGSDEEPQGPPPVDFENASSTAVLDGGTQQVAELELKPGKYAFACFISDRKGGPPHVAKGMITEVNVT